ncbi:MAG: hypothetical protein IJ598_01200 [Ruminococcus sp.]|nr:hypothetical protein [Ruminococcus sp.]
MSKTQILIDEEEFAVAANSFRELSQEVRALHKDVSDMLNDLRTGFDTPAGRKFYNSCYAGLLLPLIEQVTVIEHIADNLTTAKNMYAPVFDEYRDLVNDLNR